ncbi:endonuclease domain-containing protein [Streptomyces sp. NPDC056486]|uniref:endonuclease domain-containing protein n=1 Tax=Streptomyces sp. NPDC056486 TaxID=3345835 RepID=UPI0036A506E1
MDIRECSKCGKPEGEVKFPSKGRTCNKCIAANSNSKRKARVESGTYERHEFAIALGITAKEYRELQMKPCGVCGQEATEESPNTVYQNRETKKVAGPICRKCTTALGMLDHSRSRVIRALAYLSQSDPSIEGSEK